MAQTDEFYSIPQSTLDLTRTDTLLTSISQTPTLNSKKKNINLINFSNK